MGHHHHHHHHDDDAGSPLSFPDKLRKILTHWLKHNDDHAATYDSWADQASDHGLHEAADKLRDAARISMDINARFREALDLVKRDHD